MLQTKEAQCESNQVKLEKQIKLNNGEDYDDPCKRIESRC